MPEVVLLPENRSIGAQPGETLLEVLQREGLDLLAPCAGKGWCGKCVVAVEMADPNALSPVSSEEKVLLERRGYLEGWRLACHARVHGKVWVRVPETSQRRRWVKEKTLFSTEFLTEPTIQLLHVTLPGRMSFAEMGLTDLLEFVKNAVGKGHLEWVPSAGKRLFSLWQDGITEVTLTLCDDHNVIHVQPGFHVHGYGVAIDVGTTTLAVYLCDLIEGRILTSGSELNPQVAYGADIISRIGFVQTHPEGLRDLQQTLVKVLNGMIAKLACRVGISVEDIVEAVLVGNSVMHHLALGLDPSGLGSLPFEPVLRHALDIPAHQIGLSLAPAARLHVLPLKAGYVGADAVAAVLGSGIENIEGNALLVDMGTNGEIILKHGDRLICTSVPMGPVFEGAQITHGMRAEAGAVERVSFDPLRGRFVFSLIGQDRAMDKPNLKAKGLCGSAVIEIVAEALAAGLITPDGRIHEGQGAACIIRNSTHQLALEIVPAEASSTGSPLVLTQSDVRAVQLAKGALASSLTLLFERVGIRGEDLSAILLGGVFGTVLSPRHVMALGLLPSIRLDRIRGVGNVAGAGACMALLNRTLRCHAVDLVERMEYLLIPQDAGFQNHFINALRFPEQTEARKMLSYA
ncbi:hypothetical protein SE15_08120 [Thermanaerothrix daxensis]|uniref:2Fe-2S ferredoxin-type domain-containing protein n=1 Tax=Thermanaerothrix daxensis TaxID=869279 RepID=A0A0P6XJ57_9CHLR|nr:ASKHA domain-containing protein [Thermanaerothrix daxensis]KPL83205.1 hypothetical protein SE15_08120 [Thermanaerothrix daxensis]